MHQFYQNRSNKLRRWILFTFLTLLSQAVSAQGLFSNFDKLLNGQKEKYTNLTNALINTDFEISDVKDIQQISLDENYLNLLIQNTPTRYMLLANNDRCSIYDLINAGLVKTPGGKVNQVIFKYENKRGKVKTRILKKEIFFRTIAIKQCPKLMTFKKYFNLKNVRGTLSKIRMTPPKSKETCIQDILNFRQDLKSPYLCSIIEKIRSIKNKQRVLNNLTKANYKKRAILSKEIKEAKSYQNIVARKAKDILEGHCLNLNNPQKYCSDYFRQSFWTKTHIETPQSEVLNTYCPKRKRRQCIANLNKNPESCYYAGEKYPGIFPKPNCKDISTALLNSNLQTYYQDCPVKTGNDSITTFARVLNHFESYLKKPNNNCELNSTLPFALSSEELDEFEAWGIKICYNNKLDGGKKVCYPTLLGDSKDGPLSLSNTIYKIAERQRGYSGSRCEVIPKKNFRPSLLKYRTGCYIVTNPEKCSGVSCELKVMLGEVPFTNFFIESKLDFNLLPIDFANENKAIIKRYAKTKKRTIRSIKNISSYLSVIKNHKKAIFMGIGCAEDLLPSFFTRRFLNQCRPLPFLVDGHIEKDKFYSLITRTSLDHINAPRILPWSTIYSGLRKYSSLHPTGSWGFYAIY